MYKVFNMGHRMEISLPEEYARQAIDISRSFNMNAQIVRYVEKSATRELLIEGGQEQFIYT